MPKDKTVKNGHCLCRSVSFELTGPHNWVGTCYCESCRRGAGAPAVTFVGHPNGVWAWTHAEPRRYESSSGNFRYFCAECGSSVAYSSDRYPDEMHFHAVLLENPEDITPDETFHADEKLSWPLEP